MSFGNGDLAGVVLCDGAGVIAAGGKAAQLVSATLANLLQNDFLNLYYCDGTTAKWKVIQAIQQCLVAYAKATGIPASDLACTILAAVADCEGRCVCFHLGDGIIMRQKNGSHCWDIVSSPRNGLAKNTTYLTMNCNMWCQLQYYRWKDPELKQLLLLTDGASEHLTIRAKNGRWDLAEDDVSHISAIKIRLDELKPKDDYSCGMITLK